MAVRIAGPSDAEVACLLDICDQLAGILIIKSDTASFRDIAPEGQNILDLVFL